MGNDAPRHYLACNGQIVNIADYPELANYFEQQFGSKEYFGGDGTTTFGIPDLRGEFLRGTGQRANSDNAGGQSVGAHKAATGLNPGWTNNVSGGFSLKEAPSSDYQVLIFHSDEGWHDLGVRGSIVSSTDLKQYTSSSTSNAGYYYTRPTNTAILWCIATKNIYTNPENIYSTDEIVVGEWIDGKPLYQKTIQCTMPQCATEGTAVIEYTATGISNADIIYFKEMFLNGTASDNHFTSRTLPYTINSGNDIKAGITDNGIGSTDRIIQIASRTKSFNACDIYAIVQYTKTTD